METWFGEKDAYFFHRGTHYELYRKMGAHPTENGVVFTVYAPHATRVSVIGDFNGWHAGVDLLSPADKEGVFTGIVPEACVGDCYKYALETPAGYLEKADPFAFRAELPPRTASRIEALPFASTRLRTGKKVPNIEKEPMAILEVHLGSYKRNADGSYCSYRELGDAILADVRDMGYTHVELMGILEYPYDPSWGYQVTSYFAPTARYGSPAEFSAMVDTLHAAGISVILDWVPAHFPKDAHGLYRFDGTPLFESSDPLLAEYPEWGTAAFDLQKPEVSAFLINSALFFAEVYGVDALRVDAVAAMLYRDFSRRCYRPNIYGGKENLESIEFFRHLSTILEERTGAYLIAEDSSAFPAVTQKPDAGGLGFRLKWNMGFMNDTLSYFTKDPIHRKYHHGLLTHTADYAFSEKYVLPFSHDEVVYGKRSLLSKMPGNFMDMCGCLKTLYAFFFGFPGKKLLFMGQDFGMPNEWDYRAALPTELKALPAHREIRDTVRALIALYRDNPILHTDDGDSRRFRFVDAWNADESIVAYLRKEPESDKGALLFVHNLTPVPRDGYACGVPVSGTYRRVLSTYPDESPCNPVAEKAEKNGEAFLLRVPLRAYESTVFRLPG